MRSSTFLACILAALAALAVPAVASADGPDPAPDPAPTHRPRLGGAHQLVLTDDQAFGSLAASGGETPTVPGATSLASFQFASVSGGGGSGTEFAVSPAADYFVAPHVSIGGGVLLALLNPAHAGGASSISGTVFGIIPRVGYHFALSDTVSFWPKVYFGYYTSTVSVSNQANTTAGGGVPVGTVSSPTSLSVSSNATAVGVYAPFMFEPAPHFVLGFGPTFSTQLSNNESDSGQTTPQPKVTQVGLQATIGGWLLGD